MLVLPPPPKNRAEAIRNLQVFLGAGWILLPRKCGEGSGAPGNGLEMLVGSQGGNKPLADTIGYEFKFHSGKTLLTLGHKEVRGGNDSIRSFNQKCGKVDKAGRKCLRVTVAPTPNCPFRLERKDKRVNILPRRGRSSDVLVFWEKIDFESLTKKLQKVILVKGKFKRTKDKRIFVRYDTAQELTLFDSDAFYEALSNQRIVPDFDAREMTPGSFALKNHGTKLRMRIEDMGDVWKKTENVELRKDIKPIEDISHALTVDTDDIAPPDGATTEPVPSEESELQGFAAMLGSAKED